MKSIIQGAVVAGIVIMVTWVAWSSFQGFILGSCDPKFGCIGQVHFAAFYSGIAATISFFSFLISSNILRLMRNEVNKVRVIGAGAIGGAILSILLVTVPHWNTEIEGMVVGCIVISMVTFAITLQLLKGKHIEST